VLQDLLGARGKRDVPSGAGAGGPASTYADEVWPTGLVRAAYRAWAEARAHRARIAGATCRPEEIIVKCRPGTIVGGGAPIRAATSAGVGMPVLSAPHAAVAAQGCCSGRRHVSTPAWLSRGQAGPH